MTFDLLDPKVDFVFKKIFTEEEILIDFLNATIFGGRKKITKVKIQNPETKKEVLAAKGAVLDLKATINTGEIINIEIQNRDEKNMVKRTLFHWGKIYTDQLVKGQNYNVLNKAITINILNFVLLHEEEAFHNVYELMNRDSLKKIDAPIEIHFIELKKYREVPQNIDDSLYKWAEFLVTPGVAAKRSDPMIKKAVEKLQIISQDPAEREVYEALKRAELEVNTALANAEERGEIKKAKESALKFLKMGVTVDQVAEGTGLSIEEVSAILTGEEL
ncbi:MAG: Rpn family recombination-promoting nuclease/putative transposase [Turicibacter sp.]|nr:Rpn family recombination-promoting nuclease/putative transposase [Turicibacter sp.]